MNERIIEALERVKKETVRLENSEYGDRNYADAMTDIQAYLGEQIKKLKNI